jgi:hypothetical protein
MNSEEEQPFSMKFDLGSSVCQVCGKTTGCEHLFIGANGDVITAEALRQSLDQFVGTPVTPLLINAMADHIANQFPAGFFPAELEVKSVTGEGDRLIATVGPKEVEG